MKIKIITEGGVVQQVLSDTDGIDIEAVQIDKDYPDYEKLAGYAEELRKDPALHDVPFASANFEEET